MYIHTERCEYVYTWCMCLSCSCLLCVLVDCCLLSFPRCSYMCDTVCLLPLKVGAALLYVRNVLGWLRLGWLKIASNMFKHIK